MDKRDEVKRMIYENIKDDGIKIKDDEFEQIYKKVCSPRSEEIEEIELITNDTYETYETYELAINIDYPAIRKKLPVVSRDDENQIDYEIGYYSIEYFVYLVKLFLEKNPGSVRNPFRVQSERNKRSGLLEYENKENDWKKAVTQQLGELSLRVRTTKQNEINQLRRKKTAFVFEFMYKNSISISEYRNLDEIFPLIEMVGFVPEFKSVTPRREYVNDVIEYYRRAISSKDPYIKFISFYHVMEYFFDEIYKKKMIADLQDKITSPGFSYRNEEKIYDIVKFVQKRISKNGELGQGKELESLKCLLNHYVEVEELKKRINEIDSESEQYYQNNEVSFSSKAPEIQWNDAEDVLKKIAQRIYYTRNALVHSKSGKRGEIYNPYSDERKLQREIPLVKAVAEMIIINSSVVI